MGGNAVDEHVELGAGQKVVAAGRHLAHGPVDEAHVAAETAWLAAFDTETGGRFHGAVSFHLAHLWLTEYRKTFDKTAKEKAKAYAAVLSAKEKTAFRAALCFFGVFRGAGNRIFEGVKRRLLK